MIPWGFISCFNVVYSNYLIKLITFLFAKQLDKQTDG